MFSVIELTRFVSIGWNCSEFRFFMDFRLSSMKFCGSCRSWTALGKLYFGVVVYGSCSINKIHQ